MHNVYNKFISKCHELHTYSEFAQVLKELGMPVGNKTKQDIPVYVKPLMHSNKEFIENQSDLLNTNFHLNNHINHDKYFVKPYSQIYHETFRNTSDFLELF